MMTFLTRLNHDLSSVTLILLGLFHASFGALLKASHTDGETQAVLTTLELDDSLDAQSNSHWRFNFSSEAPHIFASAHGLLQQWPNTYFPNGHSIVPCEVPAYTNLYHGRRDDDIPPSPEWFAFDIEMAYAIMGSTRNSHILTYQTTRPAGCLYFDGESAALFGVGPTDSQMLFIYGNTTGNPPDEAWRGLWDEYDRAAKLCQWTEDKGFGGPGWGVEGIVRMNAGFEMIWCNFTSPSLRLVSHLNVTSPLLPDRPENVAGEISPNSQDLISSNTEYYPLPTRTTTTGSQHSTDPAYPPSPPNWGRDDTEPFREWSSWGWFESATWHYGSSGIRAGRSGELRVKPLMCGFLSFYDKQFRSEQMSRSKIEQRNLNLTKDGVWKGPGKQGNRSVALQELMRRRRSHTLENVTREDARTINHATERALRNLGFDQRLDRRIETNCTGLDWLLVTNDIAQRHSFRIRELLSVLSSVTAEHTDNSTTLRHWFLGLRSHTFPLIMPYFEYPDNFKNGISTMQDDPWSISSPNAQITLARCRSHYTRLLAPDQGVVLNPEESNLLSAVEETLNGICTVVVDIGFSVEREWFHRFDEQHAVEFGGTILLQDIDILRKEITRWKEGVEELMGWLGWADQWVECQPSCSWDEICRIPMWPLNFSFPRRRPGGGNGTHRYPYPRRNHSYQYPYPYRKYPGHGTAPVHLPPDWWLADATLWSPRCVKVGEVP